MNKLNQTSSEIPNAATRSDVAILRFESVRRRAAEHARNHQRSLRQRTEKDKKKDISHFFSSLKGSFLQVFQRTYPPFVGIHEIRS